jgi:hypothetical protein
MGTESQTQATMMVEAILKAVYVNDRQRFVAKALRRTSIREQ